MEPYALTSAALHEPWRLWTCHVAHFDWTHALANGVALIVPLWLAHRVDRGRLALALILGAPLLSLLLMPGLGDAEYRGASGLACTLWALVGLRLAGRPASASIGLLLLGGLAVKLGAESMLSTSFIVHPEGWCSLPAAHLWGAFLGLAFALPPRLQLRHA